MSVINAFSTQSVGEAGFLIQAGIKPIGSGKTSNGRIVLYFPSEATEVLQSYLDATDQAAVLLGLPVKHRL